MEKHKYSGKNYDEALNKAKELNKYTILNPAPAVKLDDEIIKNVDLLTPNETELEVNPHLDISDLSWSHLTLELTSLI